MKKFIIIAIILLPISVKSQNYYFTQNSNSMTLSPSFTGINKDGASLNTSARNSLINNSYLTYLLSYDLFIDKINSGFGIYILRDQFAGSSIASSNYVLNYTYEVKLSEKIYFRPALNLSYQNNSVEFQKLIFRDQINNGIYDGNTTSMNPIPWSSTPILDMATSVLFYGNNFWTGANVNSLFGYNPRNMFQPNLFNYDGYFAPRYSIFGGYKIILEESINNSYEKSVIFSGNYTSQYQFNILDFRTYFNWNILTVGTGARVGINNLQTNSKHANKFNSIIIIIGSNYKKLKIGYSYDLYINSFGYHEISLKYQLKSRKK